MKGHKNIGKLLETELKKHQHLMKDLLLKGKKSKRIIFNYII